jgi:hypothetical protein
LLAGINRLVFRHSRFMRIKNPSKSPFTKGDFLTPLTQSQTLSLNGWSRIRERGIILDWVT